MKPESELPADVIQHIRANRKIEAIKLLRLHKGIDLKDAKHLVDAYITKNPQLISQTTPRGETGIGRFIFIIIVIVILFVAIRYSG